MSDAVERVARMLAESRGFVWDELSDRPKWGHVSNKAAFIDQAETLLAKLTEQGVPVADLLSGKMVAVPKEPTPEMLEHAYHGPIISWHRMIEAHQQAQLDYAGGQVVTPEECQKKG